jgi:pimeloyl-ACP methyl ester carboxylesterase
MRAWGCFITCACLLFPLVGCGPQFSDKAKFGITFYCPGAGNFDFGDAGIRQGLQEAGYPGEVAAYLWTISFNPAIDQTLRFNAKLRGQQLARIIEHYVDHYHGQPVNVIGLSAGTGVAIWALEDLKPGHNVDNVVLLGSSLWHRYDVSKALRHVNGKIYCYYSPDDPVLAGPMKVFGTIDGVFGGEEGAGAVGLHPPRDADRVVNIRWRPAFGQYGYHGGHTDATSSQFVRAYISAHIISSGGAGATAARDTTRAKQPERAPPLARQD